MPNFHSAFFYAISNIQAVPGCSSQRLIRPDMKNMEGWNYLAHQLDIF
jgi:hypothetical protein